MKVEAWLVLKATHSNWSNYPKGHPYEGQAKVEKVRVVKIAQNKPQVAADEITMKVDFDVDEGWFLDGIATIQATIPAPAKTSQAVAANVSVPVKPKGPSPAAAVVRP